MLRQREVRRGAEGAIQAAANFLGWIGATERNIGPDLRLDIVSHNRCVSRMGPTVLSAFQKKIDKLYKIGATGGNIGPDL